MTASIAAASLLGAPLMHDFCHISLSDLLTPRPVIEKRIVAAGEADFVICFYNPAAAAAKDIWRAPLRCWRPVKRRYAGRRSQIRRTQKAGEMADHPRGDGFCPSGYDQSGDRWQQSDLHRQRPDDHPARLRAVNHGDVLVIGAPAMRGRSASSWTPPTYATPCRWRPLPASGWPAISAGRYAAGVWSGSRWRSGSERSAPAG